MRACTIMNQLPIKRCLDFQYFSVIHIAKIIIYILTTYALVICVCVYQRDKFLKVNVLD